MARRQIHIEDLRNADPKTLEVVIQDAIRKPIVQISPQTLSDLVALSDVDALPRSVARDLASFTGRVAQEIADLPDGGVVEDFLGSLDEVDAALVPSTLREYVAREAKREARDEDVRKKAEALVEKWNGTDPEPVSLGDDEPDIEHGEAVQPDDDSPKKKGKAKKKKSRRAKPRQAVDPERERWLSERIMAKLANYREAGLAQRVLIAGIRHEASDKYPDMMGWEITRALRTLQDAGQVRHSAGRWSTTMKHFF